MASINDVPPEVLTELIFPHLGARDMISMSLVSRKMHHCAHQTTRLRYALYVGKRRHLGRLPHVRRHWPNMPLDILVAEGKTNADAVHVNRTDAELAVMLWLNDADLMGFDNPTPLRSTLSLNLYKCSGKVDAGCAQNCQEVWLVSLEHVSNIDAICRVPKVSLGSLDINAIPQFRSTQSVSLHQLPLSDISGIRGVPRVDLAQLPNVVDFSPLADSTEVHVTRCPGMTRMIRSTKPGTKVYITNCPLVRVDTLINTTHATLQNCEQLVDIAGLRGVEDVTLIDLPGVVDFSPLTDSTNVGIQYCPGLTELFLSTKPATQLSVTHCPLEYAAPIINTTYVNFVDCQRLVDITIIVPLAGAKVRLEECDIAQVFCGMELAARHATLYTRTVDDGIEVRCPNFDDSRLGPHDVVLDIVRTGTE
jgi:hypothetical protein